MLEFTPLQLEDLPKLRDYFGYSGSRLCDTTPGAVFIWRDMYRSEWAVYGGSLYFKVDYPGLGSTFTLPLGGGRREHYREIAGYCCRRNMPIAFYPVPKDELERVQAFFPNSAAVADRNASDYLYRAEDLKYFRGKKLSGPRNHVNKFLKTYGNWSFRVITEEDIPAVKAFLDRYAAGRDKAAASFHEDLRKTHEVLDNYQLYDMAGGMLLVDGNIVGFSLGEIVGDTLFTHIEKARAATRWWWPSSPSSSPTRGSTSSTGRTTPATRGCAPASCPTTRWPCWRSTPSPWTSPASSATWRTDHFLRQKTHAARTACVFVQRKPLA